MSKAKPIIHASKGCGGQYEILFNDENLPYLKCSACGHEQLDWIKWDKEYKDMWKDPLAWERPQNNIVCVLGYFCEAYRKYYGVEFSLSLNGSGLFRGPEAVFIRRMLAGLGSDVSAVKEYIDWIFENKVKLKKKRITSLSFLSANDLINQFKFARKRRQVVTRDTPLPPKMLDWARLKTPTLLSKVSLYDFGDLDMLLSHYKSGHYRDMEDVTKFLQKLFKCNYIDGQFNIVNWS